MAQNILLLHRLIADFHARPIPRLTVRDAQVRFVRDMSLAIVGARHRRRFA